MSKPRIFVSSTYVDLKDLRETVRAFLVQLGHEPVLFERGGVYFDHSRPIDQSCYLEVKNCDMFVMVLGGRYGSPSSGAKARKAIKLFNSVTKREYETARAAKMPILTFINADVLAEYKTYKRNGGSQSIAYAHVDDPQMFRLIEEIYSEDSNNSVFSYRQVGDVVEQLREQLAGMVKQHMVRRREDQIPAVSVRINAYKLFYHRMNRKLSFTQLGDKAGVERDTLRKIEKVRASANALEAECFHLTDFDTLHRIEEALECHGILQAGKKDDFLTQYMHFYSVYKGQGTQKEPKYTDQAELPFKTRIVVFDFDGTLTKTADDETTWEKIWKLLGYSVNECALLHKRFRNKEFSHQEWCDITRDHFRDRQMTKEQLDSVADSIELIPGVPEVIRQLKSEGVKLYILSGSIRQVIKKVLGDLWHSFEEVRANEMEFDRSGLLTQIRGTPYDFEGKATFLKRIIHDEGIAGMNTLFVGNSCNDVWASESGARTLCVNPKFTDPDNPAHWTYSIRRMESLAEITRYIKL